VALQVDLAEPANYTFQWYRGERGDTTNPISFGRAGRIIGVSVTETTSFWVRVTNGCGSVDSQAAVVTPGPFIDKVKYSVDASGAPQLVLKGRGLSDVVYLTLNGIPFRQPATVKRNRKAVQKGELVDNRPINEAIRRGDTVTITVRNEGGLYVAYLFYTRR
jgi:hypothetical protein